MLALLWWVGPIWRLGLFRLLLCVAAFAALCAPYADFEVFSGSYWSIHNCVVLSGEKCMTRFLLSGSFTSSSGPRDPGGRPGPPRLVQASRAIWP